MSETPHILVVTVDRCGDCPPEGPLCADCTEEPDLTYSIECPGVTDACRAYWECRKDHSEDDVARMENEEEVHGVLHTYISGLGWATPSERCYIREADAVSEEGSYIAKGKPGRWAVTYDFGDPGELYLHAVDPTEVFPVTGAVPVPRDDDTRTRLAEAQRAALGIDFDVLTDALLPVVEAIAAERAAEALGEALGIAATRGPLDAVAWMSRHHVGLGMAP